MKLATATAAKQPMTMPAMAPPACQMAMDHTLRFALKTSAIQTVYMVFHEQDDLKLRHA